jgi:hypothetical protein
MKRNLILNCFSALLIFCISITMHAFGQEKMDKDYLIKQAMNNIRVESDEFTKVTRWFSDRTPKNKSGENRLWIHINSPEDKYASKLILSVSRYTDIPYLTRRNDIKTVYLMSDNNSMELPRGEIFGAYTINCIYRLKLGGKPEVFNLVKSIINSETARVRIVTVFGQIDELTISSREKKAINDVINIWELIKY